MKHWAHMRFAFGEVRHFFRIFFWETFFVIIALSMLSVMFFLKTLSNETTDELNMVFPDGMERIGIVHLSGSLESERLFFEEANMNHSIESISPVSVGAIELLPELAGLQGDHKIGYYYELTNALEVHNARTEILQLCDYPLYSGEIISSSEADQKGDNWLGLYLGWEYRDIPIGTKYQYTTNDGSITYIYEVLGILKKGCRFMNMEYATGYGWTQLKPTHSLDYGVLLVQNHLVTSGIALFKMDDDSTYEQAEIELKQIANKYNLYIETGNLKKSIESGNAGSEGIQNVFLYMFYIIAFSVLLSSICAQFFIMRQYFPHYGILCATGADINDILYIQVFKSIFRFVGSFVCASIIGILLIRSYFNYLGERGTIALDIYIHYVVWKLLIADFMIIFFGGLSPVLYIKNMSVVDLLGYQKTTVK